MKEFGIAPYFFLALTVIWAVGLQGKVQERDEVISQCSSDIDFANYAIRQANTQIDEVRYSTGNYQSMQYAIDSLQTQYEVGNSCSEYRLLGTLD
jgi:hypothetical protein